MFAYVSDVRDTVHRWRNGRCGHHERWHIMSRRNDEVPLRCVEGTAREDGTVIQRNDADCVWVIFRLPGEDADRIGILSSVKRQHLSHIEGEDSILNRDDRVAILVAHLANDARWRQQKNHEKARQAFIAMQGGNKVFTLSMTRGGAVADGAYVNIPRTSAERQTKAVKRGNVGGITL